MNDEPIEVKTGKVYQNLRPLARGHFHFSEKLLQTENPPLRSHGDFGIISSVFTPRSGGEIGRHACLRCMWRDPCGFESRPEHHVVGYSSGQRGQTVNLLACAFGGSNPPPTTIKKSLKNARFYGDCAFLRHPAAPPSTREPHLRERPRQLREPFGNQLYLF